MKRSRSSEIPPPEAIKIPHIANEDSSAVVVKGTGDGRIVDGSDLRDFTEVLYPATFDATHPIYGRPAHLHPATLMWDEGKDFTSVPIDHLSHITHDKEAAQIIEVGCKFKASKMIGKIFGRDGPPRTYRKVAENKYKEILQCGGPSVLPGYLTWWGISVEEWYSAAEDGKRLTQKVEQVKKSMAIVPDYLQTPACSYYGNNAFIMSLNHAMDCYKDSRKDCASQKIYLKKAGTLHYGYEICYVILVCMEEDLENAELRAMPSMHGEPVFKHNGYIDEHGIIINPSAVPVFNTKHVVRKMETNSHRKMGTNYNWENIVFAFYFDKEGKYLVGGDVCKSSVKHDYCISKQRKVRKKWICPNKITD